MRIIRFIKALYTYIRYGEIVDIETYDKRIAICYSCKHNIDNKCNLCKCILELKVKWSTENCPENKW